MISCHFMAHFFFIKCECVVSGHCAGIELSLHLFLLPIGSILLLKVAEKDSETIMVVVVAAMVAVAVIVVVLAVVVMALATIRIKAILCHFE